MKKAIKLILCISIILLILAGCTSNKNIHFFSDNVFYTHEGSDDIITIIVSYAYPSKKPDVGLVEVKGTSLDNITFVLEDISEEPFTKDKYNGYHVGSFVIDGDLSNLNNGDRIEIGSIIIKVDGEDRELTFKDNLIFTRNDFEDRVYRLPVQPIQIPSAMVTSRIEERPVLYRFKVLEQFELTAFETSDHIEISQAVILVNDNVVGPAKEVLPLKLMANDMLGIDVVFTTDKEKKQSSIVTDVEISGLNIDNELRKRIFKTSFIALTSPQDAENLTATLEGQN